MSDADILAAQSAIEQWLSELHLEQMSAMVEQHPVNFSDATLHACMDYVRNFLIQLGYTKENVWRLEEIYWYKKEEADELSMQDQDVEDRFSDLSPSKQREIRATLLATGKRFSRRHRKGEFPMIDQYGKELNEKEEEAMGLMIEVHEVINMFYDATESKEKVQLDALLRKMCFRMYEICDTTMVSCVPVDEDGEPTIDMNSGAGWFNEFLDSYKTVLLGLYDEISREAKPPRIPLK